MREQAVIRTVSAAVAIASIGAALLMSMGSARAGGLGPCVEAVGEAVGPAVGSPPPADTPGLVCSRTP